ncbi:MAG: hypothetical protein O3B95_04075, partial [Chloroflexi bacterium]|nr:hypothetical protein [Chloroflexota bacterium]
LSCLTQAAIPLIPLCRFPEPPLRNLKLGIFSASNAASLRLEGVVVEPVTVGLTAVDPTRTAMIVNPLPERDEI